MSTENKLPSSGSTPGTNKVVKNVICEHALKQGPQIGKDPSGDGSQGGRYSIEPICNQTSQQNVPEVIITSCQRQSQTCPKTAKRSTLIEVPIDGRHQQGQRSHSNLGAVNSPSQPVQRTSRMEDLCREKAGAALFDMASSGNDPISTPMGTPPVGPPPSSTMPCLPSPSSHVPSGQQDYRKLPVIDVPGYSTSSSQPVPHVSLPSTPPQAPLAWQQPATYMHAVPETNSGPLTQPVLPHGHSLQEPHDKNSSQNSGESKHQELATFSTNARPVSLPRVSAKTLLVESISSGKPRDPCTSQQKDQETSGPVLNSNIMRNTLGATTPSELKTSNIKDSCLPSTKVDTPEKSPGQSLVKQPSVNPKDPRTCHPGTVGPAVNPNNTRISFGQTTPYELKTSSIKDTGSCLPSTKVNTPEKSPGQSLVKQPSVNPKDPRTCHPGTVGPAVNPNNTRISFGQTTPYELKTSSIKDTGSCLPSTKVNTPEKSPGQSLVKQPSVNPKDPRTCHPGTVGPAVNPNNTRISFGQTTPYELKTSSIKDTGSCLPSTKVNTPEKSSGQSLVKQPPGNPKDPRLCQQIDQRTVGPAVNPNITRSTLGPTRSLNELTTSSIKDCCLPSTKVKTPEKSPGQSLIKQPSGNPKDPRTCQQQNQETVRHAVSPNNTRISFGPITPSDLKKSSIKDAYMPSTNVSLPDKSPGQLVVKQPSGILKDPRKCQQKDQQNLVAAVNPNNTRSSLGPNFSIELKSSDFKDGCMPSTKVNTLQDIPKLGKQPKVVLKRLKRSHCSQNFSREGRNPDEHSSTAKELYNAFWKLRSSIDAITKDEDKKSVHFPTEMSPLYPSISRSTISKHHLSGPSSSRALHSSTSKSSATRDFQVHSGKHSFGRSKSFSYSSSWRTPRKLQVLPSPSSDPSGSMKANSSLIQGKSSSGEVYGKHVARALSYEERKTMHLSASKTMPSTSISADKDPWNESDQRGVRMKSKSSLHSTVPKQNVSSGHKISVTLESNSFGNEAETVSDSEANVRKSVLAHLTQKNKPKPLMVEKKPKHSPNQPLNQPLTQNEGKARDSPSNSQKNSGSSENQPSFIQLLEIASKNASVKGNQAGNHDWQYSRKRRYSDGQINKCQPTDPRHFIRPFHEKVSSIKIPKLERLKEHIIETSDSGNVKAMKDTQMQRSIVINDKGKDKVGEVSDVGKGVEGTAASMSYNGICQGEENGVSLNEVLKLSSSNCNKIQEDSGAADDKDDVTMSCGDTPEVTEDIEMKSQATPSSERKVNTPASNERKRLALTNLFEMLSKKERNTEGSASKQDLQEGRLTGAGVQGLFSELQKSEEDSKGSSPSSPSTTSKTSSPSGSEKKLLNITHLKKVKHILTGIVLKKQASVDSDASTKDGYSSSTPSSVTSGDERQRIVPPTEDEDIFTTENSDFESSEDDDSFLQLKPSALIEETNALMDAPMPVTPSKISHHQVSYSPVLPQPTRIKHQMTMQRPHVGLTLDKILHMKIDQDMKDGDITTIRDKLMDGVSRGGIIKLATETVDVDEDIDVDPEAVDYAKFHARFPTKSEKIPDIPPGEDIFDPEKMCQLFTPTQCLCLKNFLPHRENQTSMESLLLSATPEEVEEIITSSVLELCESIPDDMMRWMFLLISIHPSAQENYLLYQTQWMHLNKASLIADELRFPWIPSLKDILSVLLNYGGDLAGLVSVSDCELDFSEEMLRDEFAHGKVEASTERRDVCFKEEEGIFAMILRNHLCQVIKVLTQAIFTHMTLKDCSGYRTEELQCLLIVMMRIALDKTVIGLPVAVDITMAIAAILEGFEESVWYQEVERMCDLFPLITSHHHNMVYLLWSCMPLHIERGRYLCRRLGYAGLQNLVLPEKTTQRLSSSLDQNVPCIKISSLIPILQCCKPSTVTDYYQLNSIIQLLDYSIGNEILETYEKRELDQIIRKLREMVGDIRESALSLSRSQVKSLMVRTAAKLSFMTQSMLTNQESIFSFLRSDTPVGMEKNEEEGNPEHHIRSQDDAASLPSDDDDDDDNASTAEMEQFSDDEVEAKEGQVRVKDDFKVPCDNEGKEDGQRVKEGDKQPDFEEQGEKDGLSVHSGKSRAGKDLEQETDVPSDLEAMETSADKGDQLNPEILTNVEVEHASKEIQLKPKLQTGVEKIKTVGGMKEVEPEPEIKANLEVNKTARNEDMEQESEVVAGVDVEKRSQSEEPELQLEPGPEIPMDIGENRTSEGKDLEQKSEISVGVEVIQTSEGKNLEQNSEVPAGVEVEERWKKAEVEPHVKGVVQAEESSRSKEMQDKPDVQLCLQAGKSLSDEEVQLDPDVQAAVLNEKTLKSKDLQCKSVVQVPAETGEVSRGRGEGGESSLGKEEKICPDVANDGKVLIKEVTPRPLADQVISPEKVMGGSSQTKNVWVPVKVESDFSPVKGSLEEDVIRPVSVSITEPVPPTVRGVSVVKIEKEEQVIDLTSPERKEVIELEWDDDVICLD